MVDKIGLTEKQLEVFDYIRAYHKTSGVYPTHKDMSDHFGTSRSNIAKHLAALERRGWINRSRGTKAGLTILQ